MTHTPHSMLTPGQRRPYYNWPVGGSAFTLIKDVEEALTLGVFPDLDPADAFVYDRFGNVRRAGAWTEEGSR